jgi:hypothetical protein
MKLIFVLLPLLASLTGCHDAAKPIPGKSVKPRTKSASGLHSNFKIDTSVISISAFIGTNGYLNFYPVGKITNTHKKLHKKIDTGSAQTFKPSDITIGISSNGDIVTSGLAIDTPHVIESSCFFTFPNGKQITCDSLYKFYENQLDSLIKEMRGLKTGPRYTINEAVHGYDSIQFSIPVPTGTVGWYKFADKDPVTFFGFYPGRAGVISNYQR